MKKIVYLMMAAMICLTSCDKENEIENPAISLEDIYGFWHLDKICYEEYEGNKIIHSETDSVGSCSIEEQNNTTLFFNNDGSGYTQESSYERDGYFYKFVECEACPFVWSFSEKDNSLTINDSTMNDTFKVKELSSERLTIVLEETKDGYRCTNTIYLLRGQIGNKSVSIKEKIIDKLKQFSEKESYKMISESYFNNEHNGTTTSIVKDGIPVEIYYTDSQGMITGKYTMERSGNTAVGTNYCNPGRDSVLVVNYRNTYEFASATSTRLLKETSETYDVYSGTVCNKSYILYTYSDDRLVLMEEFCSDNGSDDYYLSYKDVYTYKDDYNYEKISYYGDTIPTTKMIVQGDELSSTIMYLSYNYYDDAIGQQIPGWTLTSVYWNHWKDKTQTESLECIARELSSDGELVTLYHDVYEYDGYGLMTSCTTTDENGTTVTTYSYERLFEVPGEFLVSEKMYIDGELCSESVFYVEGDNVVNYEYEYYQGEKSLICKNTYIL